MKNRWRWYTSWVLVGVLLIGALVAVTAITTAQQKQRITLRLILAAPAERWEFLLPEAEKVFEAENPDIDLDIQADITPFGERLTKQRAAAAARTPVDIVSFDQPEVGEFAAAGFAADLTDRIAQGDANDPGLRNLNAWFGPNGAATQVGGRWHAIWAWTDARLLWYWKDLVAQAGVNPATDMLTWGDYIDSCQRLDETLAGRRIEGCLLIGQPWIADWTLPYVWMQGGDIGVDVNADVARRFGAEEAWVPTFDTVEWKTALAFTRAQVDAGIDPFTEHQFGPAFVSRRWATWLGGTWVLGRLKNAGVDLSNVGLLGAFPVPAPGVATATMAGGWTLGIATTSRNPDIAWEFVKVMLREETLGKMTVQFGFLPTRADFAQNLESQFRAVWNEGNVDRWSEIKKLQPNAFGRPSFPTWPQVGAAITDMIQQVQFDNTNPADAAAEAQRTVLDLLDWPAGTRATLHDDQADGSCAHPGVDLAIAAVTPGQTLTDTNGDGTVCTHLQLP
ncbi:MAG: extracellular solute-binding protein [Candidatus Bipolaricaulia bacterium]